MIEQIQEDPDTMAQIQDLTAKMNEIIDHLNSASALIDSLERRQEAHRRTA